MKTRLRSARNRRGHTLPRNGRTRYEASASAACQHTGAGPCPPLHRPVAVGGKGGSGFPHGGIFDAPGSLPAVPLPRGDGTMQGGGSPPGPRSPQDAAMLKATKRVCRKSAHKEPGPVLRSIARLLLVGKAAPASLMGAFSTPREACLPCRCPGGTARCRAALSAARQLPAWKPGMAVKRCFCNPAASCLIRRLSKTDFGRFCVLERRNCAAAAAGKSALSGSTVHP